MTPLAIFRSYTATLDAHDGHGVKVSVPMTPLAAAMLVRDLNDYIAAALVDAGSGSGR